MPPAPAGTAFGDIGGQRTATVPATSSAAMVINPMPAGLRRAELLPVRKYRPAARAVSFGSSVSEMIDGATPMRASVSAKVLCGPATAISQAPDQSHAAGADVTVHRGDDGHRGRRDGPQQRGHLAGAVHRDIPGVPAGGLS